MTSEAPIVVLAGARETAAVLRALQGRALCVLRPAVDVPMPQDVPVVETVPEHVAAILDITHAFDVKTRADVRAAAPHVPYARVARPLWKPTSDDNWTEVDTIEQAVSALPAGARVFAATGHQSQAALGQHDGPVYLRQLRQPTHPPTAHNCTFVVGNGPFEAAQEVALLERLKIDVVLARNVGGPDSFPKLEAARRLALPAILLRPPPVPAGPVFFSPPEVAKWVNTL